MNIQKFLLIFTFIFSPIQAMAYIDPGSGSAVVSAIIGFVVALLMGVKTYWYKIKGFFVRSKNKNQNEVLQKKHMENLTVKDSMQEVPKNN